MSDHMMLARVLALSAELDALRTEVLAMDLDNTIRFTVDAPLNYLPDSFTEKANQMRSVAEALNSLGYET